MMHHSGRGEIRDSQVRQEPFRNPGIPVSVLIHILVRIVLFKPWLLSSMFSKLGSFALCAKPSLERGWQFPDQMC